ncbi:hypothetical protein V3C99_003952 [Haemonchus contortus]
MFIKFNNQKAGSSAKKKILEADKQHSSLVKKYGRQLPTVQVVALVLQTDNRSLLFRPYSHVSASSILAVPPAGLLHTVEPTHPSVENWETSKDMETVQQNPPPANSTQFGAARRLWPLVVNCDTSARLHATLFR